MWGWFSQNAAVGVELFGTISHARAYHSPSSKVITAINLILGRTPKFFIPYLRELSHFIDRINDDGKENRLSGEDALKDLEVIIKAYKNQIE